jgi:hypothetical protein
MPRIEFVKSCLSAVRFRKMKIRTELQLCEIIDADLIWRKKELTDLKFLLETAAAR